MEGVWEMAKSQDANGHQVAPGVYWLRTLIANVCLISNEQNWALVDAGMGNAAGPITQLAEEQFGPGSRPSCIIMTHGHFDHVGALRELAERWDVPIYAHELEIPYLTGQADYPPPDPTVGGGLLSILSPLFPNESIDLGDRVRPLPANGAVPGFPEWRWLHTPGHTPGHISLFRERDQVLIAGDAFTTVHEESILANLLQQQEVHRPPAYFTTDWIAAGESVRRLADLDPSVVVTGHGTPMHGAELNHELDELAHGFFHESMPEEGQYVPDDLP